MDHKRIAESLVRKFKTRDPFRIASELGYIVIRAPLKGIRGFWKYVSRRHIIVIHDGLTDMQAQFTLAHEIGHVLMHRGHNRIYTDKNTYFQSNRQEIEANRFALDLMYGDEDLSFLLEHPVQLAADFMGVSIELAEYRLRTIH